MPTRRAATTPEGAVLKQCLHLLKIRNVPAWRNNSGALPGASGRPIRFGLVGSSDILGLIGGRQFGGILGRFLAIECKAPGKECNLAPAQWHFLKAIHDAGGVALVISEVGKLARILDELEGDPGRVYELPPKPAEKGNRS